MGEKPQLQLSGNDRRHPYKFAERGTMTSERNECQRDPRTLRRHQVHYDREDYTTLCGPLIAREHQQLPRLTATPLHPLLPVLSYLHCSTQCLHGRNLWTCIWRLRRPYHMVPNCAWPMRSFAHTLSAVFLMKAAYRVSGLAPCKTARLRMKTPLNCTASPVQLGSH